MQLVPVPKTYDAALQVMAWRNDLITRSMSFHQAPKVMPNFWDDFQANYFVDGVPHPMFGMADDTRVGFLRFRVYPDPLPEPYQTASDISIMVSPDHRGKGYGLHLLQLGTAYLHQQGWQTVIAEIRPENTVSIRLFEKAGYIFLDQHTREIHDLPAPVTIQRYVHHQAKD